MIKAEIKISNGRYVRKATMTIDPCKISLKGLVDIVNRQLADDETLHSLTITSLGVNNE